MRKGVAIDVDMKSYVKYEKELERDFRERLNEAKRLADVGDVFVEFAFKLLKKVRPDIDENLVEDVVFDPEDQRGYRIIEPLRREIAEELETSDLSAILERMAKAAVHRYEHIVGDEDRTDVFRRTP